MFPKKKIQIKAGLSPVELIKRKARTYPVHICCYSLPTNGISQIVVARMRPNGKLIMGGYVVDTWCLGVKNTLYHHDLSLATFELHMDRINQAAEMIPCSIDQAATLIYGSIDYAEKLGFKPEKDFAVSQYILPAREDVVFEEFEFGKDGKPFYFSGPYDNVKAIVAKLEKTVGKGNFDFAFQLDDFQ